MNIKIVSVLGLSIFLLPACQKQNSPQNKPAKEHKVVLYVQQVKEEFGPFFKLIYGPFGNGPLYCGNQEKELFLLVQTQVKIDRNNLHWVNSLFGEKKMRKRFPLVFYAKKIKGITLKLTKLIKKIERGMSVSLSVETIEQLQRDLIKIRQLVKKHSRYERERDLYELHQACKDNGVIGFIKPAISIATKIV